MGSSRRTGDADVLLLKLRLALAICAHRKVQMGFHRPVVANWNRKPREYGNQECNSLNARFECLSDFAVPPPNFKRDVTRFVRDEAHHQNPECVMERHELTPLL